jgi:hypothetical protein
LQDYEINDGMVSCALPRFRSRSTADMYRVSKCTRHTCSINMYAYLHYNLPLPA